MTESLLAPKNRFEGASRGSESVKLDEVTVSRAISKFEIACLNVKINLNIDQC